MTLTNEEIGNELRWKKFSVGSGGSVCLVDWMGDDHSIVEAARVSYGEGTRHTSEDRTLIRYLMRHWHSTPQEMAELKFRVRVPMDTWRQWIRTRTASVNEYCLAPGTKILKNDLTWVNVENLVIDDTIVGFQENPLALRKNNLIPSKVTTKEIIEAPCYKIYTDKGEVLASEEHLWVARAKRKSTAYEWIKTSGLKEGMDIAFTSKPWEIEQSHDSGWLSGIFDGEGWLSIASGRSTHIGVAQREGAVLQKIEILLKERNIPYTKYIQNKGKNGDCWTLAIQSRWAGLKLLGSIRPMRLIEKSKKWYEGGRVTTTPAKIIKIEYVGIQQVVGIGTETKTLIANGFLSHNSTRYSVAIDECETTNPEAWRLQAENNKQGSQGKLSLTDGGALLSSRESEFHSHAREIYEERLSYGIAREQARKDLPLSNYTEAFWKIDLHNLFHFLYLRMDSHAQQEIREFATTIGEEIVAKMFPLAWEAFVDYRLESLKLTRLDIEVIRNMLIISRTNKTSSLEENFQKAQPEEWTNLKRCRERDECREKLINLGVLSGS